LKSENQVRIFSIIGMAAAGVWLIALIIEYKYGLLPPGDGSVMYYVDQSMFFLAQAGYLFMLWGLWKSNAAGTGRFGKISVGIFIFAIACLVVAQVFQWLTKNPDFFLYPLGGILQLLGGLLTGFAVITARRWAGWRRFAPLLQGLYYLALFIMIAAFNQGPSQLTEALWQVTWFITSFALFTMSG